MASTDDAQNSRHDWEITWLSKPKLDRPIMIEGLPGIGNVGKMVMDLVIQSTKAKKLADFFSYDLPPSVYIMENHLISLPRIEIYHARRGARDFLFMTGDAQPVAERASYALSSTVIDLLRQWKSPLLVTTGGIGLDHAPEKPKVFCSGTDRKTVDAFTKGMAVEKSIYGKVGPIMGVTGLLLGAAKRKDMPAVTLLAETFGHPLYLGLRGAKEILMLLDKKYALKIDFRQLDKELEFMDDQIKGDESRFQKAYKGMKSEQITTNYIG
jgi:proteasome assembly chaperone (PAC2) family protein